MWKFMTRGIRETLERRACRTNVYSQTSQDNTTKNEVKTSLTCNHKFLAPTFLSFNKEFCGSTKANGAKDKDYDSKWNAKHSWPEAVGWSSVLAIGWVVCQTLCLRRRLFEKEKNDSINNKLSQYPEPRISYVFGQVLNLRPKHVLPVTNCIGNDNNKSSKGDIEEEWKSAKPFGPITIEEAFKQAAEEFANIHKIAVGEFELQYGLRAIDEKRYKDAIRHFTAGAKLSSSASMFNLGLCYELGLGTLADQTKAAEYYYDAAQQGHADATYNLGVFCAQGRGGFSVDIDRARSYFVRAAELGQTQAQQALDLENRSCRAEKEKSNKIFKQSSENTAKYIQKNSNVKYILKKLSNYNNALNTHLQLQYLENSRHEQSRIEAKKPTEIYLDILGLNEPNMLPVQVETNTYSVPC